MYYRAFTIVLLVRILWMEVYVLKKNCRFSENMSAPPLTSHSVFVPPQLLYPNTPMSPTATLEYSSHAPEPLTYPRVPKHSLLPCKTPDYLRLILTSKVYDILKETPLVHAPNLSAKLGNEIWLKREDLQEVFSFKIRGAFNFMASLTPEERWKGVITCSAGG